MNITGGKKYSLFIIPTPDQPSLERSRNNPCSQILLTRPVLAQTISSFVYTWAYLCFITCKTSISKKGREYKCTRVSRQPAFQKFHFYFLCVTGYLLLCMGAWMKCHHLLLTPSGGFSYNMPASFHWKGKIQTWRPRATAELQFGASQRVGILLDALPLRRQGSYQ